MLRRSEEGRERQARRQKHEISRKRKGPEISRKQAIPGTTGESDKEHLADVGDRIGKRKRKGTLGTYVGKNMCPGALAKGGKCRRSAGGMQEEGMDCSYSGGNVRSKGRGIRGGCSVGANSYGARVKTWLQSRRTNRHRAAEGGWPHRAEMGCFQEAYMPVVATYGQMK